MSDESTAVRITLDVEDVRGILKLLTGLECRAAEALWPDSTFITLGSRDKRDQDPVTGGAWSVSNLSATTWLRAPEGTRHQVTEKAPGRLREIAGRIVVAADLDRSAQSLSLVLSDGWEVSFLPEPGQTDPDDLSWELLTPEEPRRAVRARPAVGLVLENYFYPDAG